MKVQLVGNIETNSFIRSDIHTRFDVSETLCYFFLSA